MAPLVRLPVCQALTLPDLHEKTLESPDDTVNDVFCSTPTPWADRYQPDFMLSAIPSSFDKYDPKEERAELLAYPRSSEPMQMQANGNALDISSVQYMYLSPQCLPLQHGLAQMCLAVEKPGINQNSWCATDGVQVKADLAEMGLAVETPDISENSWYTTDDVQVAADQDWVFGTTEKPHGENYSERNEVSIGGCQAVEADQQATKSVDLEQHNAGQCKPCAWFWKKQGCRNGDTCSYCHLCPEGELRLRKRARLVALKSAV